MSTALESDAVKFKTRFLVFEMDAVMKELLGQLIAQFLVDVITVHTDVAQENCHATTVSKRNADVTVRRSRFVREAAVCSDRRRRVGSSIFACTSGHTTELMDVAR